MRYTTGLGLGYLAATAQAAAAPLNCRSCTQTITRDVVVVGGGASGAHAAVWLRDNGQSVVVVEKADQLGGHTDFYHDPATGKDINVGVQAWMEYKQAFDFPARMNVSTSGAMQFTPNTANFIDYKTGKPVPNYAAPAPEAMFPALQRYLDVLLKYEDMVLPGFFNFPSPQDIPEDLLMPFGELAEKYDFLAAVPQIWDSTGMGLGDMMNVPALWVFQASGVPMVKALLGQGAAAVPASGRLYDLFEAVANFLGDDVLYSSTVAKASRHNNTRKGVTLIVQRADGSHTCVEARRLVVAIPPTLDNMQPFLLEKKESDVLAKFNYPTVYAGVLSHPSLQTLNAYSNRSPAPGTLNYTVFPVASQVGRIDYLGGTEDLFQFTAVGTQSDTAQSMQALIAKSIDTMVAAGTLPETVKGSDVKYQLFANHGHMHAQVSADELRAGFMQRLYALQGNRNTWYTGAAFSAGFATTLWEYNKVLLPKVVEGL